ncbi:MAG: 4-hydroxy-tetrahydrodipicolinate synthase [Clostridia bacterium]|nr:4-hydroxy-tetrahydrodipicolinate synthase [Clostridia bacterium]
MIFKGSGVALVTPFDKDNNVNYSKLEELIEFQIENDTDAIIVCGTTGETSTLSNDERKKIMKYTVEVVDQRIPVIAGTACNNTSYSCELSEYAENVAKVDGLLLVTPYYNKCSQEGLYLNFKKIANSVTIPIILYNVPSRTSLNLEPDTLKRLSEISNICGVKEASNNIAQITEIASKLPKNFAIYSGNDDQIVPVLSIGGAGVISVIANILPKQTHDICELFFKNKLSESLDLQLKYFELIKNLFIEVNPAPIKEAMNILGYDVGKCRLPLCDLSKKNIDILKQSLKTVKLN